MPYGPDIAGPLLETVQEYLDVGYDHLYFHQVGHDVEGFLRFWESELRPELARLA